MGRPTVIHKYRSKHIGKFYMISATPLNNYRCRIEITKYIKPEKNFKKKTIGTFPNQKNNQEAAAVYFNIKTVKTCNWYWNLK